MLNTQNITVRRLSEENNEGTFLFGPLPKGFGSTIGNPIRRVLLSTLEGGAITSVRIAGVDHEYSTLEGVHDDVLRLIMKLKAVAIRCYSDEPVSAKIEVKAAKGETVMITAGDIVADSSVEVVNKDFVITSVSDGNKFSAELIIEKGYGYKMATPEKRYELGVIPVDGVFSPVENVEMKISSARVGQRTDFEQIMFKIRTNGVLTPTESIQESVKTLSDLFVGLVALVEGDMNPVVASKEDDAQFIAEVSGANAVLVSGLELSTRLKNSLSNSAITDLRTLDGKSKDELLEIRGMGQKSVDELIKVMKENGLKVIE